MANPIPELDELLLQARQLYAEHFTTQSSSSKNTIDGLVAACAPGRVNLIGEHTDYNEGLVLPVALPMLTVIVGGPNETNTSEIYSSAVQDDTERCVRIDMPTKETTFDACGSTTLVPGKPKWANYVKGVIANFMGYQKVPGFNAVIVSSVPIGGGLSSSASLEVAMFTFLEALTGTTHVLPTDKALLCQKAEHDFAGMPCGIMDQFISVMGKADHALLIDCRSVTSKLIPMTSPPDDDVAVLIINSNVKHELTGSEYPTRRKQCYEAAAKLGKRSLRAVRLEELEALKSSGTSTSTDPIVIDRASHVIAEIQRTADAADALTNQDYVKMGELMYASHESLRTLYGVSCEQLDQLVGLVRQESGVYGSRMTGGGFGGCTVTLVSRKSLDRVIDKVRANYNGGATFYVCKPSDGARILNIR